MWSHLLSYGAWCRVATILKPSFYKNNRRILIENERVVKAGILLYLNPFHTIFPAVLALDIY
jgi:hypothetical protein